VGFSSKTSHDWFVGLLRKQIGDLDKLLKDVEDGRPIEEDAHLNLKRVEQQIRWLRKAYFNL